MHFGLWYAAVGPFASPDGAAVVARTAEEAGFESLWTGEHIVVPAGYASTYPYSASGRMATEGLTPMAEPLVWYAYVAALTTTIRLAPGVLVVPQRNPLLLAKQVATLDHLARGRFILGVGVGWLREEFDAVGAAFEGRGERLEEYLAAMQTLWAERDASFSGRDVAFTDARMEPKPPRGSVPVVVGGHTARSARRAGRLGAGWFPAKGSPEEIADLVALARKTAAEAGHDPAAVELTVCDDAVKGPDPHKVIATWADVGASRILVRPDRFDLDTVRQQLADFGTRVIADAR